MPYYEKIKGDKVFLSPIDINDTDLYTQWVNDPEIVKYLQMEDIIITREREYDILKRLSTDDNNFAIIAREENKLIGSCGFLRVDNRNHKAEVALFIGDKNYWNKGYGTEALKLLLDFGFCIRNFNSIMLIVKEFNERAIKSYKKLGFKIIGKRRESNIYGEKKYDDIYMDILASDFRSRFQ